MVAIMEKRARAIFRDALMLHYIDDICVAGEEVELWLKTHGGWFPDPREDYGYGSLMPEADGPDVMSKEPEKAMKEAKGVMSLVAEFLEDGIAEHMGLSDLKGLAEKWLDDLKEQAPASSSSRLTEANVEAHEFRLDFAHETLQSFKDRKEQRDRSRSPRRCVIPQMTIAVLEDTIRLKDDGIKRLEGRIQEKNNELVKNAYRISYLETTVKAKDEMFAMKDDLHNKVMATMESLFKKP